MGVPVEDYRPPRLPRKEDAGAAVEVDFLAGHGLAEISDKSDLMWQVAISWLVLDLMTDVRGLDTAVRAGPRC